LVLVLGPNGTFTFTPSQQCTGNDILFEADTQNTVRILWDFGDGIVEEAGDSVVHYYDLVH